MGWYVSGHHFLLNDTFLRSPRIKEYFLAKEREFPVDGSSDSEDDNEIPRLRKKVHGIPN
jgi:hypothetical protein